MITFTRVLIVFVLSTTFSAGCGPSQQQQKEAEAAKQQKQEQQQQQNIVIARKILALIRVETHNLNRAQAYSTVRDRLREARLLAAEYQGPGYQQFHDDVIELFRAIESYVTTKVIFHEVVDARIKDRDSYTQGFTDQLAARQSVCFDACAAQERLIRSKYLGEK